MHPLSRRQDNIRLEQRIPAINLMHEALNPLKALKYPAQRVAHLGESKLLADADARAGVEGDVVVRLRMPRSPALGAEDARIGKSLRDGRVQIRAALHDERRVTDGRVLEHRERLGAVGAAASGQSRVLEGDADVEGHGRVEAERLVEDGLEIRHVLEVVVRGQAVLANGLEYLGAQAAYCLRMPAELVDGPREDRGGGVAAGEQDGDDLVTQDFWVAREAGELVQEGVVLVGFGVGGELLGTHAQGALDEVVDEVVHDFEAVVVGFLGDQGPEAEGAGEDVLHALDFVEGFGKLLFWGSIGVSESVTENKMLKQDTHVRDLTSLPSKKSVATSRV